MSKTIEELPDGAYHEEIVDYDACRHMYNDVCCNDKSESLADYPGEYCEKMSILRSGGWRDMKIIRKKATFALITKSRKAYVLQFSLKDPWWYPKCNRNFLNGSYTLFGWLFIYFGWTNREMGF